MSGSTRSRQKRKLEPISLEELAGTTGMSGFCSFLTRDNSVPVPALDRLEEAISDAVESHASESSAPETTAPVECAPDSRLSTAPELPAPVSSAPVYLEEPAAYEPSAPDYTTPDTDALESSALNSRIGRRPRIREASTVQDAHSLAEQAVYDAMYRAGKPYQGDSRSLTIGLRTLAELSRMAYSNCKANVRSLVAKLAIDEQPGFSYTDGRTYIVYSFREILRRRKTAGLTHVIRTRGVAFVDPQTGRELATPYTPDSSAPESTAPKTTALYLTASDSIRSAPASGKTSAPKFEESSALPTGAYIENRHLVRNTAESSSSVPAGIVTALRRYISDVDDSAAADLWRRCLGNAPDATLDEVVHFIDLKAGKPGIRMPLGFLLTAVPKCFQGEAFRQFREERELHRQSAASRDRQFAEEILKSPEADDEQRQWAGEVLGLTQPQ
jgi:hypothetical protein